MKEIPIAELAKIVGPQIGNTIRKIKFELFNGVVETTRHDTGRLKGGWQVSTGSPATGDIERIDTTPDGSSSPNTQAEILNGVAADTMDFLTNNVEYANIWNERDGIIDGNIARIERFIKEAVRDS